MNAKPITLVLGPYDDDDSTVYETLQAYLIGDDRALFISEGQLWAQAVRPSGTAPDYYVGGDSDPGVIIAEEVAGTTADVVPQLIAKWAAITALDFIVRDLVGAPLLELGLTI